MELLRSVIDGIYLPSWVGRVPQTVGQVCGGELKADEWIVLFTIILVPTLGIICTSKDCLGSLEILHNFLHLVSSVNIIRQRQVHTSDANQLPGHIQKYLAEVSRLFPTFKARPNHHLAIHIPECIARFGSAPWWTGWAYEGLNGALRAANSNRQLREPINI
jgi:hypothetical protein